MARIRWDIGFTLVAAALIGLGAHQITGKMLDKEPQYPEKTIITDGSVGAQADQSVPRASSIEEMKAQNSVFTIDTSWGAYDYLRDASDYYYIDLQSGETVIARVYSDSIQTNSGSSTTMPIGRVINKPLPPEVLDAAKEYHDPTDPSFYIDMCGDHQEVPIKTSTDRKGVMGNAWVITMVLSFPLLRLITVKIGLFPPMFSRKYKADEI